MSSFYDAVCGTIDQLPAEDQDCARRLIKRMDEDCPTVEHFYRRYKAGELDAFQFIRIAGMARREDV